MRVLGSTGNLCLDARRWRDASASFALLALLASPWQSADGQSNDAKRRITVKDTIEMTEFADRGYFLGGTPSSPVAIFSPDRKRFLIRLKKGDVERNAVEYRLLLFETNDVFRSPNGKLLVTMSSSSNREAIQEVRWLDNRSIVFLGENIDELSQVYRADIATMRTVQLTHHPAAVVSYDISRDGREIVYEAAPSPEQLLATEEVRRNGVVITSQTLDELLSNGGARDDPRIDRELFIQRFGHSAVQVPTHDFLTEYLPLVLSPDGRFAILAAYLGKVPDGWERYEDSVLRRYIVEKRKPGTLSNVEQYMLVNLEQATIAPLLDAPKAWMDEGVAWSRDGRSVILSGTYLPLDGEDPNEEGERRIHPFVVEVEIPSRRIHGITGERRFISHWDDEAARITLEPGYGAPRGPSEIFEKVGDEWRPIPASTGEESKGQLLEVSLKEDRNSAPMIYVKDGRTGKRSLLLDLNPQFREFSLGNVETVKWRATDGHEVGGGLYFPPDYQPGHRYPLVIQTHGYEEDRFWMNGPWNSAFAAQPLAAQGIMVLQVGDSITPGEDRKYVNTPSEGPRRMAAFEGAIDELDRRGLIDRDRVGIIGFSRTVFQVAFTLTNSRYRFRAATLADGFEGGYLSYLLWKIADYEGINGGVPVGPGLRSWLEKSPAFRIETVSSPVRLEYYGPLHFLGGWQWFSLLSILDKPVDLVWLPRGAHLLVKPWERLASQQGNVDWFQFWLLDGKTCRVEDGKTCDRWRSLAALQNGKAP
jgi:dipeptidyl aminopeptidase/acylaminoacyl peptidase